jgi:phosphatidylglycerophosphate synthase
VVIAADTAGKAKTIVQDIFLGATIGWFAWRDMRIEFGWETGWLAAFWDRFHGATVAVTLGVAIILTVISLLSYIYQYRKLFRSVYPAHPGSGDGT